MSTPIPAPQTPADFDALVRLALGLPDAGESYTDPLAAIAVRATLQLDSFAAGEELRLQQIVADRRAERGPQAQSAPTQGARARPRPPEAKMPRPEGPKLSRFG